MAAFTQKELEISNKSYNYFMENKLQQLTQKLYEEGYLTYPRTNSEYLATAEKDKIKAILEQRKEVIEKDLSAATEAKAAPVPPKCGISKRFSK